MSATDSTQTVTTEEVDFEALFGSAPEIITGDSKPKPNMFSTPSADLSAFDEEEEDDATNSTLTDEQKAEKADKRPVDLSILDEDNEDPNTENPDDKNKKAAGRPKTDKSALVSTVNKLIEAGTLVPFDEDKALEDYTEKDFQELIEANLQDQKRTLQEETHKEFLESLPKELVYAAKYAADGGTDLKGLFRVLSQVEETRQLDVSKPQDQERIVRQYLEATEFGSEEDIDEQLELYKSSGVLAKWADKHKPKLDAMHEEQVEVALKKQEDQKIRLVEQRKQFNDDVLEVLEKAELGGVKIDRKRQQALWEGMTQTKYQTRRGQPTNQLGKLLEDYQFGETKRYDLIQEALWLLSDPEDYRSKIAAKQVNQEVIKTARTLKSEQNRKNTTSTSDDDDTEDTSRQTKRKLERPGAQQSFFRARS